MADLLIYNKLHPSSLAAVYLYHKKNGSGYTALDVSGKSQAQVQTALDSVPDNSFDSIYVFVPSTELGTTFSGTAGAIMNDHLAYLEWKLKSAKRGVEIISGACATNSTATNVKLDSGDASTEDDVYNGKYLLITVISSGANFKARQIKDYTGSTKICVVNTTATAVTDTHNFSLITPSTNVYLLGNTLLSGLKVASQTWAKLYPNVDIPYILAWLDAPYKVVFDSGTGTMSSDDFILDGAIEPGSLGTTGRVSDGFYKDMYLYIYSASEGAHQYRKITEYTASSKKCVLETPFDITPDTNILYRIVKFEDEVYKDAAVRLYFLVKLDNISVTENHTIFSDLIDSASKLNLMTKFGTYPDYKKINEMFEQGKLIHEALAKGVTSIPATS